MKLRAVDWLVCPMCRLPLELSNAAAAPAHKSCENSPPSPCSKCRILQSEPHMAAGVVENDCGACNRQEIISGKLVCPNRHVFDISEGVASLVRELTLRSWAGDDGADQILSDAAAIQASFDREWSHFDYSDRTWSLGVQSRRDLFLSELDCQPEELRNKLVLDAGCGNGTLSRAVSLLGCEVVAVDVSHSVDRAFRHFAALGNDLTHFMQVDLMRLPFPAETFDFIYSSGVLHHNPDTRAAFESVLQALKPGGKIYIWVYHKVPGWRHALRQRLRALMAPLPGPIKHALVCLWLPQAMIRQYLRTLFRRNGPEDRLKWRERLVVLLDHYTARYRWEHTQQEIRSWYRELGLCEIAVTEVREWGFGVVGCKPAAKALQELCG